VVFAKAESNRAAPQFFVATECPNYRRWLQSAGRTRRAGRDCDALHVQMNQQTFAFNKSKRNIRKMRQTLLAITVEDNLINASCDLAFKAIAQTLCLFVALVHLALREFRCSSERNYVRHLFSSGTTFALLMDSDLLR